MISQALETKLILFAGTATAIAASLTEVIHDIAWRLFLGFVGGLGAWLFVLLKNKYIDKKK